MIKGVIQPKNPIHGIMVSQECLNKGHLINGNIFIVIEIIVLRNPVRKECPHKGRLIGGNFMR